jgi:putative ABC transport system permease protein
MQKCVKRNESSHKSVRNPVVSSTKNFPEKNPRMKLLRTLRAIWEGIKIALSSIRANKMRAFLTTFGIIIGILSVTTMATIIDGVDRGFASSLNMLGKDVLYVQKWPWSFGPNYKWWLYMNRKPMKIEYVNEIKNSSRLATGVAASTRMMTPVSFKGKQIQNAKFLAVTPSYIQVASVDIEEGRFFTEEENYTGSRVCVIGVDIAENVFPSEQPLGKRIRIKGQDWEVIGILKKQGKFLGLDSFDDQVMVPMNTFTHYLGLTGRDLSIIVKFDNKQDVAEGAYELEGIMRRIRKLDAKDDNDFAINKLELFQQQYQTMTGAIYGIGIFLTALSLFVGGIGVMNIMFVSVKERTKEIGIRKAIGARSWEILLQFLVEAVIICLIGGIIGVGLSVLASKAINEFFVAYMDWGTVAIAFTICTLTGLTFGFLPAYKASKSDPISSLRYE